MGWGQLHTGVSARLPRRRLLGGAHTGGTQATLLEMVRTITGHNSTPHWQKENLLLFVGLVCFSMCVFVCDFVGFWVCFFFFQVVCFFGVFCFLKEKYSEDTKQTLVQWQLLLTSQGDQMAHLSVMLKSVTLLASL